MSVSTMMQIASTLVFSLCNYYYWNSITLHQNHMRYDIMPYPLALVGKLQDP